MQSSGLFTLIRNVPVQDGYVSNGLLHVPVMVPLRHDVSKVHAVPAPWGRDGMVVGVCQDGLPGGLADWRSQCAR